jgi:integrase
MAEIGYHVFRKPKKNKAGKKFYRWYYYFYDQTGKKIQKACSKCKNRSDAESYIRTLPPIVAPGAAKAEPMIKTIAENMYIPGSAHVDRRRQLGKSTTLETLLESRAYIAPIVAKLGDIPLSAIEADDVVDYLFTVPRSGLWKNRFLQVLKEVYREAPRYGSKVRRPDFPGFARNSKKADIFTGAELNRLFVPENFPDTLFFLFFLLSLSAGLRLGEARAVRLKQIIFDRKALIIDGFCKKSGERTGYNKMGSPEHPKLRVALLPDFTLAKINEFLKDKALGPDDFIFTYNDRPVRQELAENVFVKALINAGLAHNVSEMKKAGIWQGGKVVKKGDIIPDRRKLVPHSLRYTYVTRMLRDLSAKQLQPMTGHATVEMVDYYNRRVLDDTLAVCCTCA